MNILGWHKAESDKGTKVQIKTNSTIWSYGCVDINEIGSTVLMLPAVEGNGLKGSTMEHIVIHVEVKFAEKNENCAVTVIIWREILNTATAFSICNNSSYPVVFQQAGIDFQGVRPEIVSKFEVVVPSNQQVPFGWTDPEVSSKIRIAVGSSLLTAGRRTAEIDFLVTGNALRLANGVNIAGEAGEVVICVDTYGSGRILYIVDHPDDLDKIVEQSPESITFSSSNFTFGFNLREFGISLVLDRPERREFLSFTAKQFMGKQSITGDVTSFEFTVGDIQVDNYSETAVYPVILYPEKLSKDKVSSREIEVIKFCAVKVNSSAATQHYRYMILCVCIRVIDYMFVYLFINSFIYLDM